MSEIVKYSRVEENNTVISLVLPAYKCADIIGDSIKRAQRILRKHFANNYEIIVVVDGFDQKTVDNIQNVKDPNLRIIHYSYNLGKGFAVRIGMKYSKGKYVGYIDAGTDISAKSLERAVLEVVKPDSYIVCGSKKHSKSKVLHYTSLRKFYTAAYNIFLKILFGIDYSDTQVGLKFYKSEVLEKILPYLRINRFAFEIEMLVLADKQGYSSHVDIPVDIEFKDRSAATGFKSIANMINDTLKFYLQLNFLGRYSKNNSENAKLSKDIQDHSLNITLTR